MCIVYWHICCALIACCPAAEPSKGWGLLVLMPVRWGSPGLRFQPGTVRGEPWGHKGVQDFGGGHMLLLVGHGSLQYSSWSQGIVFPIGVCWIAVILAHRDKASTSDFYPVWRIKICWGTLLEALEGPDNMEPIMLETYDMYNVASEVFFISCPKQLHQHI